MNEDKVYLYWIEKVGTSRYNLKNVPKRYKTPEICLIAIRQDGMALEFVPQDLLTYTLCLEAVGNRAAAIDYVPREFYTPEFYLEAVKLNGKVVLHIPHDMRTSEMYGEALRQGKIYVGDIPDDCVEGAYLAKFVKDIKSKSIEQMLTDDNPLMRELGVYIQGLQ